MIFESVNNITSKDEFLEKILIYIRLVEVFAERNKFVIPTNIELNSALEKELINIGVIGKSEEINELNKVLKKDCSRFIDCVHFYLCHKKEMGTLLDKLSNEKRRKLQEKEKQNSKPTFVDFFAGAGGLSC